MLQRECNECGRTLRGRVAPLHCPCRYLQDPPPDPAAMDPPAAIATPAAAAKPATLLPDYQCDRIHACGCCSMRRRIRCGELIERGKGAFLMAPRGIPNKTARCPLGRWSDL